MASIDYTELLTSQHIKRPKFLEFVAELTKPFAENVDTMLALQQAFDLDVAEGKQLDTIGLWVGASRRVVVPLAIFFSFDTVGLGFDEGIWKGPFDVSTGITYLDDATYRSLIRTKIAANSWNGSLNDYQDLMQLAFPPANNFFAVDNQDMTMTIHVTGPVLSAVLSALLQSGALSEIRPAGVAIAGYVLP